MIPAGYRERERLAIKDDQLVECVVTRQDPAVLGPEARTLVSKLRLRAGDLILVLARIDPETPAAELPRDPGF